jgi:cytochrome c peroxidase
MSLANVAYARYFTWANPKLTSLEEQALIPMLGKDPVELGLEGREEKFLAVVRADPVYRRLFPEAFGGEGEPYTIGNVTKAIAAFERTIISMRSPYDRYRWGGDSAAISGAAKRGEVLFFSSERAGCFQCHAGWNFSGPVRTARDGAGGEGGMGAFFNPGVGKYAAPNRGLFEQTRREEDIGKFRAPSLRNIAVTAPYMHDGSLAGLEEVLDHYASGGRFDHPNRSRTLRPFWLTEGERRDLIEFLESLTDRELLHDGRWSDPWPQAGSR